ncbi:hypothetical protein ADUPG1_008057 [Aduncisulcus paluster]|uniref:Protein kinase domain-containing protein n=1 Tax=Aduncisulcus paluster TaxID=2918883 RepID=A0ABQ5KTL7_9EUKA|nr:hypothetical protein ADUPG1_008057 [Aduncisulcus paluster]
MDQPFSWYSLPIGSLDNVISCEIDHVNTWQGQEFSYLHGIRFGLDAGREKELFHEFEEKERMKKISQIQMLKEVFDTPHFPLIEADFLTTGGPLTPTLPLLKRWKGIVKINKYAMGGKFVNGHGIPELTLFRKGKHPINFECLHLPLKSESNLKSIHVCVNSNEYQPQCLAILFYLSSGEVIRKQYRIPHVVPSPPLRQSPLRHVDEPGDSSLQYEWFSLPVGTSNVIRCDIECQCAWNWDLWCEMNAIRFVVESKEEYRSRKLIERRRSESDVKLRMKTPDRLSESVPLTICHSATNGDVLSSSAYSKTLDKPSKEEERDGCDEARRPHGVDDSVLSDSILLEKVVEERVQQRLEEIMKETHHSSSLSGPNAGMVSPTSPTSPARVLSPQNEFLTPHTELLEIIPKSPVDPKIDHLLPTISVSSELQSHPHRDPSIVFPFSMEILPLCTLGQGAFGEVLLVQVPAMKGSTDVCVLKKMLKVGDKSSVQACYREFRAQQRLFMNPLCFNRIPRPLFVFDRLDDQYHGILGFMMEYCVGGSVSSFAVDWCSSQEKKTDISSNSMDPLRVAALCVGCIECLNEVISAKADLVHRDIKPENFLVRVSPETNKCTIVLGDLGLLKLHDTVSFTGSETWSCSPKKKASSESHPSLQSMKHDDHESLPTPKDERSTLTSFCGTLVYNAYECLNEGLYSQSSDAYALGMTILSLFTSSPPFFGHPLLHGVIDTVTFVDRLISIFEKDRIPSLLNVPLFDSLQSMGDDGQYSLVYECLNEVYSGLTSVDMKKRMSVKNAFSRVQKIKPLLPDIGVGWKPNSLQTVISKHTHVFEVDEMRKFERGSSHDLPSSVYLEESWDKSL